MNCLTLKSNNNLMALKTSNSFGDQIIALVDVSMNKDSKDKDFPYLAGKIVSKIVNPEGAWIPFTEKAILKAARSVRKARQVGGQ